MPLSKLEGKASRPEKLSVVFSRGRPANSIDVIYNDIMLPELECRATSDQLR